MAYSKGDVNSSNFLTLAKEQLEYQIKKELTDTLIKEQLDAYELKVRQIVEAAIEPIQLDFIESRKDLDDIHGELKVFMHWRGKYE